MCWNPPEGKANQQTKQPELQLQYWADVSTCTCTPIQLYCMSHAIAERTIWLVRANSSTRLKNVSPDHLPRAGWSGRWVGSGHETTEPDILILYYGPNLDCCYGNILQVIAWEQGQLQVGELGYKLDWAIQIAGLLWQKMLIEKGREKGKKYTAKTGTNDVLVVKLGA